MNKETDIISIKNFGKTPIILTGPHNGWNVPQSLMCNGKPLGVEEYWFDPANPQHRHEACDWGMAQLFDEIEKQNPEICLFAAKNSRLVVDLNRTPKLIIYENSSETGEPIPGNTGLSTEQKQGRMDTYYHPYHQAVDQVLQGTIDKFGHALWIDMHSFTPIWNGTPREVGIGTLKTHTTPFSEKAEQKLEQLFRELFVPDQPYPMYLDENRQLSSGVEISARNNVEYFGLEIRNDLLSTTHQITVMAEQMINFARALCD